MWEADDVAHDEPPGSAGAASSYELSVRREDLAPALLEAHGELLDEALGFAESGDAHGVLLDEAMGGRLSLAGLMSADHQYPVWAGALYGDETMEPAKELLSQSYNLMWKVLGAMPKSVTNSIWDIKDTYPTNDEVLAMVDADSRPQLQQFLQGDHNSHFYPCVVTVCGPFQEVLKMKKSCFWIVGCSRNSLLQLRVARLTFALAFLRAHLFPNGVGRKLMALQTLAHMPSAERPGEQSDEVQLAIKDEESEGFQADGCDEQSQGSQADAVAVASQPSQRSGPPKLMASIAKSSTVAQRKRGRLGGRVVTLSSGRVVPGARVQKEEIIEEDQIIDEDQIIEEEEGWTEDDCDTPYEGADPEEEEGWTEGAEGWTDGAEGWTEGADEEGAEDWPESVEEDGENWPEDPDEAEDASMAHAARMDIIHQMNIETRSMMKSQVSTVSHRSFTVKGKGLKSSKGDKGVKGKTLGDKGKGIKGVKSGKSGKGKGKGKPASKGGGHGGRAARVARSAKRAHSPI